MESLVIKNLNFRFKNAETSLFSNWNLRLKQGHICAIVGPSGIGKTSLGLMIAGHIKPDSGEISWNEKIVLKPRRDIFLIHQEDDLFPWLNVYEQLKFVGGTSEQIENLLKQFKLTDFKNYYPYQLSGGMKKRLAIMRAECAGASLLILDETLSSLDKILLKEILTEMVPHWKSLGKTVVLITHQLDDVKEFVDTIVKI
jgi:NitT/TauT family transport system ATP-binding protein